MRIDRQPSWTHRKSSPRNGQRGAALVEFSLVAGLLLLICLGIFELGTAWSHSQLVTQAARSGARSVSQLGINGGADEFAVLSVEAALGETAPNVDRIVIYKATDPNGAMPPACVAAVSPGVAGQCSVYDASDFSTYGFWVNGSWPPSARNNDPELADFVGVRVEISQPMVTGLFGGGKFGIKDTAVMRVEPDAGNP